VNVLAVSDFLRSVFLILYFALRKPTRHEIDEKYLADRELQRAAAARPVGGPGLGPY
jgi:hypothetical protein